MRSGGRAALLGFVTAALVGLSGSEQPGVGPASRDTVTFVRDVAPILRRRCASCHRPGGPAPFSLLTYQEARDRAALIAAAARSRRMPPWLPSAGRGEFQGERRLTDSEIRSLVQWAEQGALPGDLNSYPPAPDQSGGWHLGEPDLVVTMPEAYTLPARGAEVFRNFVLPAAVPRIRWVEAVELDPGSPRVVHHAMLMVDRTPASRQLDARDPEPGFVGMHGIGNAQMPSGFFLGWTPGRVPSREPAGLAWRLEPASDLVLQLHLRPDTAPASIVARVALYFADAPTSAITTALRLGSQTIDIPPGTRHYTIRDSYVLPVDVEVLGVYPHAHYLAREMTAVATRPGGAAEWLLHIAEWDFNWQDAYRYARPIPLPRGTTIAMEYGYDNSAGNPHNPSRPPGRVVYGPRSVDEMADLWLQVALHDSADLAVLRRDFEDRERRVHIAGLRQHLRLHPEDAAGRLRLGNALLADGRPAEAALEYRSVLAADPDDGNAHFSLAQAFQALGRPDQAIAHYSEALRLIPEHVEAHTNMGNALFALNRAPEAVESYRRALALEPDRAGPHNNLGVALLAAGRGREGLEHLREAARLAPGWAAPVAALAWALATHPDDRIRAPAEAIGLAERAVVLTERRDARVLSTLAAALAAQGAFARAVPVAEEALAMAEAQDAPALAMEVRQLLALYRRGVAYRVPREPAPRR